MQYPAPICVFCSHFKTNEDSLVCDAYADGIPDAILKGKVDHQKPYEGDGGIQFKHIVEDI
jgi:hypothetical protein